MGNPDRVMFAAGILASFAAFLCACATGSTVTTRTVLPRTAPSSTWTGRTVDEVERVWGNSSEREPDGEGGYVLVYRENTSLSVSTTEGTQPEGARTALPDPERTQSERITTVRARFWVDAGGKVYRHWFAQEIYDQGKDAPPARD